MKEIPLRRGGVALVDDSDFDWLSQWKWSSAKRPLKSKITFYVARREMDATILMHRLILGCGNDVYGDHIDGNGLNNQRDNLRIATPIQNGGNRIWHPHTSKFKGVNWNKRRQYWQSVLKIDYKSVHLGCFDEEIDAAIAYNRAAVLRFGEFAKLNPIPEGWIHTPARVRDYTKQSRKNYAY